MRHYTRWKVRRRGKKDGRNWQWEIWPFFRKQKPAEPKIDQTMPAQFEKEIVKAGESHVAKTANAWKKLDITLKPRYCQARQALLAARESVQKERSEAEAAMAGFETAEQSFRELEMPSLDPRWRLFWLIIIGVAEFPLNGLVFSIFGAGRIETYIMASAMCLLIPLAAHFFGQALRQENKTSADKGFLLIVPPILLGVLAAVAFLRAKFFEAGQTQELMGITLSPQLATILFLIINVALFLIAIVISYEGSHPNQRQYNTRERRMKEALKRLKKESSEAEAAARKLAEADRAYHKERQHRHTNHEQLRQDAEITKETAEWLVTVYRDANIGARHEIPECFKQAPMAVSLPEPLLNLDWECEDVGGEK